MDRLADIKRAVDWCVGEGIAYWHPDLEAEQVAEILTEIVTAYREIITTVRLDRLAKRGHDLTPEQMVAYALMVIRHPRLDFRGRLFARLHRTEVVEATCILLTMIRKVMRWHGYESAIAEAQYRGVFGFLLTKPLNYDRRVNRYDLDCAPYPPLPAPVPPPRSPN